MGYRFALESVNTIANLTFGKITSVFTNINSSWESYEDFRNFLDSFSERVYSDDSFDYSRTIRQLSSLFPEYEKQQQLLKQAVSFYLQDESRFRNMFEANRNSFYQERADKSFFYEKVYEAANCREQLFLQYRALEELSSFFSRCKIKALLLPPLGESREYSFMQNRTTLERLYYLHSGDSCLILQPEDPISSTIVFDAFPNFSVALRNVDLWPGVLLWNNQEESVFIPIRKEEELLELFERLRGKDTSLNKLRRHLVFSRRQQQYIFHLSDLHFGPSNVALAEERLKDLIESECRTLEATANITFILSGDIVDSPSQKAIAWRDNFIKYIETRYNCSSYWVLGNHDINKKGIAFTHGRQTLANYVGDFPRIEKNENSKTLFLFFNSNTNGSLAKGEIGEAQMLKMSNLLDREGSLTGYKLIAVLHHHILPIEKPDYYAEHWYEKVSLGKWKEKTLLLKDASSFIRFLRKYHVSIVLHGHKHIPFFDKIEGITVIGCGSSTGRVSAKKLDGTYISFNLLKLSKRKSTCVQVVDVDDPRFSPYPEMEIRAEVF